MNTLYIILGNIYIVCGKQSEAILNPAAPSHEGDDDGSSGSGKSKTLSRQLKRKASSTATPSKNGLTRKKKVESWLLLVLVITFFSYFTKKVLFKIRLHLINHRPLSSFPPSVPPSLIRSCHILYIMPGNILPSLAIGIDSWNALPRSLS